MPRLMKPAEASVADVGVTLTLRVPPCEMVGTTLGNGLCSESDKPSSVTDWLSGGDRGSKTVGIGGSVPLDVGCVTGNWFAGEVIDRAWSPGRVGAMCEGCGITVDDLSTVGREGPGPSSSSMDEKEVWYEFAADEKLN